MFVQLSQRPDLCWKDEVLVGCETAVAGTPDKEMKNSGPVLQEGVTGMVLMKWLVLQVIEWDGPLADHTVTPAGDGATLAAVLTDPRYSWGPQLGTHLVQVSTCSSQWPREGCQ